MKLNNKSNRKVSSPMLAIAIGSTLVTAASIRNTCYIGSPKDFGEQLTSFHDPTGVCDINPQLRATINSSFGAKHLYSDGFNVAWGTTPQALKQLLAVSAEESKDSKYSKFNYGPFVAGFQTVVGFPMDASGQGPLCPSDGNYTISVYEPNYDTVKSIIPTYTSLFTWLTQNIEGLESLDSKVFYELHEMYIKTYSESTILHANIFNPVTTTKKICECKGHHDSSVTDFDPAKDCKNKDFLEGLNAVCSGYDDGCDAGKELQAYLMEQTQNGTLTAAGLRGALINAMDMAPLNSGSGLGFNKAPFDFVTMKARDSSQYYFPEEVFLENLPNDPEMKSGKYLSFKNFEFTCNQCACELLTL